MSQRHTLRPIKNSKGSGLIGLTYPLGDPPSLKTSLTPTYIHPTLPPRKKIHIYARPFILSECCDTIQLTSNVGVSGTYQITSDIVNGKSVWKNGESEEVISYSTSYGSWTVANPSLYAEPKVIPRKKLPQRQ